MKKAANSSILLKDIHITDNFWRKYIKLVKDVIIPYQWDILNDKLEGVETSHCIENFRIAAGESRRVLRRCIPGYRCGEMAGSSGICTEL